MVASFGPESPILDYKPRAYADSGKLTACEWIAWPARAFRVIAPRFWRHRFNALQKAVLGVLRATRLTPGELGERLGVEPELAAFVVAELQGHGFVNNEWAVSDRGSDLLDEEFEQSTRLVPGWMFKDPWNGHIWPFVAPSLEYARIGTGAHNNTVVLERGTTGAPRHQRFWRQPAPGLRPPEPPDAHQILRSLRDHRRLERQRSEIDYQIDEDDFETGAVEGLDIDRISSIELEPEPVFLLSYLYVPDDDTPDWYACDFFGRGSDPTLRRLIIRVAEKAQGQGLARRLDSLLGLTTHDSFDNFKRVEANRKLRARRLLERTLTTHVSGHESVSDVLTEVVEEWLEFLDLGPTAGRRRGRNVLTSCRNALEQLFSDVSRVWPLRGVSELLSKRSPETNEKILRGAACELGLTELPRPMRRIPQKQIRSVSEYSDAWRLRPLVAATILRARMDREHPLWSAAKRAPDLVSRIDRVAELAGKAAHAGGTEKLNPDKVERVVQETLEVAACLLNLPARPIKEILRNGQEEAAPTQANCDAAP